MTADPLDLTRLERLLALAPVLSRYHGARGFETERFIRDYEEWREKVRAAALTPSGAASTEEGG